MMRFISLVKSLRLHARLFQQLARRGGICVAHHRQQHATGGFGVSLGVVVVKFSFRIVGDDVRSL